MKKMALISGLVFVSFLFISHGLYAQGFYRYDPGIEEDFYDLNLTQEQMEAIEKLELELEKELSPLISELRSNYVVLEELEAQRAPDSTKMDNVWDVIYRLEDDIQNIEISHEKKIRDLLTEDQRAIFDSYYGYGQNPYDRGGFGRGYSGRGIRGFRGGNYGYGRNRYGAGRGRGYLRGYGMNRRNFRLGASRLSGPNNYRYFQRFRYGRGPCGAGLGKWYRWDYGRGRWKWND